MALAIAELDQQALIATELDQAEDPQFLQFLAVVWTRYASLRQFSDELGYLYPKRAAVQYLLSRARNYMTWQRGKLRQQDRQRVQNLTDLLNTVQEEIDVLLGRQKGGRPPAEGLLQMMAATSQPGGVTRTVAIGSIVSGTIGTPYAPTTTAPTSTPKTGTTPAAAAVQEVGKAWVIIEGGFSQEVLPANPDRTLVSVHNTSSSPLWVAVDEEATTGAPSTRIAARATWAYDGADTPLGSINVVGATTGQTLVVREEAEEATGADADVAYLDLSGSIESGGESQQLAEMDQDRVYLTITNTSNENLWLNVAEWASMDDNSILILPAETKEYTGDACGPEDLYIIGPTTGQTYSCRVGSRASP